MTPTSRFSLERHEGPEAQWPLRSRLLENGRQTPVLVTGHYLRHQFEVPEGYLLISDFDCPFEESNHFTLVSSNFRVLSRRFVGWMYCSFLIDTLHWLDERHLNITFCRDEVWQLTIRSWGIPYLYPRLGLRRLNSPNTIGTVNTPRNHTGCSKPTNDPAASVTAPLVADLCGG